MRTAECWPGWDLATLRYMGNLQRIAICYFFASMLVTLLPPKVLAEETSRLEIREEMTITRYLNSCIHSINHPRRLASVKHIVGYQIGCFALSVMFDSPEAVKGVIMIGHSLSLSVQVVNRKDFKLHAIRCRNLFER